MHSRWFNVAVIFLWLSAMGWLVKEKLLPPLLVGKPPSARSILEAQRNDPLVGWAMTLNGREVGWALNTTTRVRDDLAEIDSTEISSRVHFEQFPLEDLIPDWLRGPLRLSGPSVDNFEMDVYNRMLIDPLGRLSSFKSAVRVGPLDDLIRMEGTIEGNLLKLTIQTGDLPDHKEFFLPRNDVLLSDSLSPQSQLPGLRSGQTWTVPVYSPLRPLYPLEVLQARVEGTEPIIWNGRQEMARLVVYRQDRGSGPGSEERARARLWVRRDGTVLRQEMAVFNSTMALDRLSDRRAARLAREEGVSGEPQVIDGRHPAEVVGENH